MPNQSEIENFILAGAYSDGVKIGKRVAEQINEGIMSGHISPNESLTVHIDINELFEYDFSLRDKILARIGSPLVMSSGNAGLAVGGGAIVLQSGKNFLKANNKVAKVFYALSVICSGTGTVSSSISVYCDKCGLSRTGLLGDGFGGLFLYAGNKANAAGQILEGKQPRRNFFLPRGKVTRPLPKFGSGYRGMSFVGSSTGIPNIPYLELISAGITVYTTYRCVKSVVRCSKSVYSYVEKKCMPKPNPRHVVWFISEYLVEAFSVELEQTRRISHAALKLHYDKQILAYL